MHAVGQFNSSAESISTYFMRLNSYMRSQRPPVAEDDKKDFLIGHIGAVAMEKLRVQLHPVSADTLTYAQLVEELTAIYTPVRFFRAERLVFQRRVRAPNETFSDYSLALRQLAATCDFGNGMEDRLIDQFLFGLNNEEIATKLAGENIPFKRFVAKACYLEGSVEYAKSAAGDAGATSVNAVKKKPFQSSKTTVPNETVKCFKCGGPHYATSCSKPMKCVYCGKEGHSEKFCHKKKKQHSKGRKKGLHSIHNQLDGDDDDSSKCDECTTLGRRELCQVQGRQSGRRVVTVQINGVPVGMQVDTAADESCIGEPVYRQCLKNVPLKPTQNLFNCSKEPLSLLGECQVKVAYGDTEQFLRLVVHKGPFPSLMGIPWLEVLPLNWDVMFPLKAVNVLATNDVRVQQLKLKFPSVFGGKPGPIKGHVAQIILKPDTVPVFVPHRQVPIPLREKVEQELHRMVRSDFLEPTTNTQWGTPIVVVPKASGDVRICGDYSCTVNPNLSMDHYPLPLIDDLSLLRGQWFCKIDISQAYLQLCVGKESQNILTLSTHIGCFKVKRLLYGIASAPAIFQQTVEKILSNIPNLFVYLDDILICAATEEECMSVLQQVLAKLSDHNIALNESKCEFFVDRVQFLGHVLDGNGLHVDESKVKAIADMPPPRNLSELQGFLGAVKFYYKFIPNASTFMEPLNMLLRKDVPWSWGQNQAQAFLQCKSVLGSSQVLVPYSLQLPLRLTCDASQVGAGAVLSHILPSGDERPICFTSKTFTSAERNYAQVEREAAAVIFGVTHFHKYLWGRDFELVTDHSSLTIIFGSKTGIKPLAAARLQRWNILLQAYRFKILYKKGTDIPHADMLSRLPISESTPVETSENVICVVQNLNIPLSAHTIAQATEKDPVLVKVRLYVQNGWPTTCDDPVLDPYFKRRLELSVTNGCLTLGARVCIPKVLQQDVLTLLHAQHPGMSRMKTLARNYVWWPGLDADVARTVALCSPCQQLYPSLPPMPLSPWPWPQLKWERVHADFCFVEDQTLLVIVDAHSKWPEVIIMKGTTASAVIEKLDSLVAAYGLFKVLVTDNGPPFQSQELKEYVHSLGAKHLFSPPYYPRANGQAEKTVQHVKRALKKSVLDHTCNNMSLQRRINAFLTAYRTTPDSITKVEPAELFLSRKVRTKLALLNPLSAVADSVSSHNVKVACKHKTKVPDLKEHDTVWTQSVIHNKKEWKPGCIVKQASNSSFDVMCEGKLRKNVSVQYLRPRSLNVTPNVSVHVDTQHDSSPDGSVEISLPSAVVTEPTAPEMSSASTPSRDLEPLPKSSPKYMSTPIGRPQRLRRPPVYLKDYEQGTP